MPRPAGNILPFRMENVWPIKLFQCHSSGTFYHALPVEDMDHVVRYQTRNLKISSDLEGAVPEAED